MTSGCRNVKAQDPLGPQGFSGTKEKEDVTKMREEILLALTQWLWHSFMWIILDFVVFSSVSTHTKGAKASQLSLMEEAVTSCVGQQLPGYGGHNSRGKY